MNKIVESFIEYLSGDDPAALSHSLRENFERWNSAIITTTDIKKPPLFTTFDIASVSRNAASVWVRLSRNSQETILNNIRSITDIDPGIVIGGIFQMFSTLALIPVGLANIQRTNKRILKKQEAILGELSRIGADVRKIGAAIDERVIERARKGLYHLNIAATSELDAIRNQHFQLASSDFGEMIALNPLGAGIYRQTSNVDLIVLGYWGNHLTLGLQGDSKSAFVQVYESTIKFPEVSLQVFDPAFFYRPYREELDALLKEFGELEDKLKKVNQENDRIESWAITKKVGRHVGGAFAGMGMAMVAGIVKLMDKDEDLHPVEEAVETYQDFASAGEEPDYITVNELKRAIVIVNEKKSDLLRNLNEECIARLKVLNPLTLEDLLLLPYDSRE